MELTDPFSLCDPLTSVVSLPGAVSLQFARTYHMRPQRLFLVGFDSRGGPCAGHLFTDHPPMKLVDVYAAMLSTLAFRRAADGR
jgi:hypothetical protein